jgi:hypothetical protein
MATAAACSPRPASVASSANFRPSASTSATAPKAPMRESFMISSARSRSAEPPSPSATSASPSSWKAPVSITVAMVLSTAATSAPATPGSPMPMPTNTSAATAPTSQPMPGRCAALARSICGLKPTHAASGP